MNPPIRTLQSYCLSILLLTVALTGCESGTLDTAALGSESACGNYVCEDSEACADCPQDCGACVDSGCHQPEGGWLNLPVDTVDGDTVLNFRATPTTSEADGVIGLSDFPATQYSELAAIVRFGTAGVIEARDGGEYRYDSPVYYQPGQAYYMTLEVDAANNRYTVEVSQNADRSAPVEIATNFAFRSDNATPGPLTHVALFTNPAGNGLVTTCSVSASLRGEELDPCGDGVCDGTETCQSCPGDCGNCGPTCGDGTCQEGETCAACPGDCGQCPDTCGDGECLDGETCGSCATDCGACNEPGPVLTRGPYLQMASSNAVTIKWRTESETDAVVYYGLDPVQLTGTASVNDSGLEHEVRIEGLSPGTRYYYAFGKTTGEPLGGDATHFFTTSPSAGTAAPTRIWVIGDSGKPGSDQIDVFENYVDHTAGETTDIWLMLGDNAYGDGTDGEYQAGVFEPYEGLLRNAVVWPTLGNHDDCLNRVSQGACADLPATLDGAAPYYQIFSLPTAGESGGVPSGTEAYYAFDHGNIHFVNLNSQTHSGSSAMLAWLEADLAANQLEWLIAFWHHPAYTNGSHNSDDEGTLVEMRETYTALLEDYGVDLIFAGHSHTYERSALLSGYQGDSGSFDAQSHVVALNGDGTISDGNPNGDGAYAKSGTEGAVYSVVGSSSKVSSSDFPSRYWSCKDGHIENCDGGPVLPGMVVYLEELGSVVVEVNKDPNVIDVVFLQSNGGGTNYTEGDRFQIVHQ